MIVIPMAGLSRRFLDAGYTSPKYMLPLHGRSVFAHAIESFSRYFEQEDFLFVARDVASTPAFLKDECAKLGIRNFATAILNRETAGQAETVELGLSQAAVGDDVPLAIFNIDTFRYDVQFPADEPWFKSSSGYLEVFRGGGQNWSYVGPSEGASEPLVNRTTEKQPISDLCCDGLYYFSRAEDFRRVLLKERKAPQMQELYVAPLYNHLIAEGLRVHYQVINDDELVFCGVPDEYRAATENEPFSALRGAG